MAKKTKPVWLLVTLSSMVFGNTIPLDTNGAVSIILLNESGGGKYYEIPDRPFVSNSSSNLMVFIRLSCLLITGMSIVI